MVARGQEQGRRVREVGVVLRAAHVLQAWVTSVSSSWWPFHKAIHVRRLHKTTHTHMHTHNTQLNTHTHTNEERNLRKKRSYDKENLGRFLKYEQNL